MSKPKPTPPIMTYGLLLLAPDEAQALRPTEEETRQALADAIAEEQAAEAAFTELDALRAPSGAPAPAIILKVARDRLDYATLVRTLIERATQ